MRIGTKSVLFGAHAFWLHPWFLALAWWKLYGFPWDPRLWVAFFVHDLGYWGSPNMDGPEGERHPERAALWMSRWFDRGRRGWTYVGEDHLLNLGPWGQFVLFHSRFYAKGAGVQPSRLCVADKLAVALEPWWFYLILVILTGEIHEYQRLARDPSAKYGRESRRQRGFVTRREWCTQMQSYCRDWAYTHADGREDTWTPPR